MMHWTIVALVSGIFLMLQAAIGHPAERPMRVSFAAPATSFLPLWIAKEARLFNRHNLSVELVQVGSSPIALSALLTDEIDILGGGGTVGPTAYLRGTRDLALFGLVNNKFVFAIYAHPSIKTVEGLRGKRIGVTRFGGTLDFAARHYLGQSGLDPHKDVTRIQLGRVPDIATALAAGSIDAGTVSFPHHLLLKKQGFQEIADLSKSGRYATTAFLAKRQRFTDKKSDMENFVKGLIEGLHYLKTHRSEALKVLAQYTRITDMEVLEADYQFHVDHIFPQVPQIEPADLVLILQQLAEADPKAKDVDPAVFIYGDLVKDVVKSGFVDRLYKK